jgi:hypothetical protein
MTHPLLPMMKVVKLCIVSLVVFCHNLYSIHYVNSIFVGTHVKKINAFSDGGIIRITNNKQCNYNLNEVIQKTLENVGD